MIRGRKGVKANFIRVIEVVGLNYHAYSVFLVTQNVVIRKISLYYIITGDEVVRWQATRLPITIAETKL